MNFSFQNETYQGYFYMRELKLHILQFLLLRIIAQENPEKTPMFLEFLFDLD